ncbi:unnamed protein product, partial [Rotaria sp. Silwood2]
TKTHESLLSEFQNILITLFNEYKVPIEEVNINQITADLFDEKLEALDNIKDLLSPKKYSSFLEKFTNHSHIIEIWKSKKTLISEPKEDDLFIQFQTELESLKKKYGLPDDLDFNDTIQRLFDESTEASALEDIKEHMPPKKFKDFQDNYVNNSRLKEIREMKTQMVANNVFTKFRSEIIVLLESEGISTEDIDHERLSTLLFDNQNNVDEVLTDQLEDILAPRKMRNLSVKIQSSEKLKQLWCVKQAANPVQEMKGSVKILIADSLSALNGEWE